MFSFFDEVYQFDSDSKNSEYYTIHYVITLISYIIKFPFYLNKYHQ